MRAIICLPPNELQFLVIGVVVIDRTVVQIYETVVVINKITFGVQFYDPSHDLFMILGKILNNMRMSLNSENWTRKTK